MEPDNQYLNLSSTQSLILSINTLPNTLLGSSIYLILRFVPKMFRIILQAFSVVVYNVGYNNVCYVVYSKLDGSTSQYDSDNSPFIRSRRAK